jgi:hypothetical protein
MTKPTTSCSIEPAVEALRWTGVYRNCAPLLSHTQEKLQLRRCDERIRCLKKLRTTRVGQNRIYTPYMTVYLMISLPKIPYIHRICMVLANPTHHPKAWMSLKRRFGQLKKGCWQWSSFLNAVTLGSARTVYTHRIWPYVWWFPSQKYRINTVYTYKCMVLANPR